MKCPLAIMLSLLVAPTVGAEGRWVTVVPEESDEILANPGMGWETFHCTARRDPSLPPWIPSTVQYARWGWGELEPQPGEDPPVLNILDLSGCPFMDSSGLGIIVSHMVHCKKKGIKMIAAGMTPRVREVFKLTRMDSVVPIAVSVEEAEAN